MPRLHGMLAIVLPLLSFAAITTGAAQTSDDGRPKKVVYNGQNYFVDQSPGGFALRITPEGSPGPIGMVDIRTDRVMALNPNNFDTVKGVYDAYKTSGSTFAAPQIPGLSAGFPAAPPAAGPERTVTFPPEGGAIVKDPSLQADVRFNADGTEAAYVRQGMGMTAAVPMKTIVTYEGGDAPPSEAAKTGKFLKGLGTAVLTSESPRITSRIGTHGNDVWKVVSEGVRGKTTLYESGSSAQGYMAAQGRDRGQDIGLNILANVRADREAAAKAAVARKAAGENVQFDIATPKGQRAGNSLEGATEALRKLSQ